MSGGLVGAVDGDINISNSYFAGDITYAKNSTGGLVGCHQSYNLEISNSYTSFTTNGTKSTNAQAIIGKKASTYLAPVVTNTYWNTDKTSLTSSYGTGLTSAQLKDQSNFTGWDADVWDFSSTTPTLKAPYTKTVYTLTGATMQGMTADTVVSGYKNSTAVFSSRDVNVQIETKPTDTVADIMNQFKTQVEAQGYTFDWSISNGQITVTTMREVSYLTDLMTMHLLQWGSKTEHFQVQVLIIIQILAALSNRQMIRYHLCQTVLAHLQQQRDLQAPAHFKAVLEV